MSDLETQLFAISQQAFLEVLEVDKDAVIRAEEIIGELSQDFDAATNFKIDSEFQDFVGFLQKALSAGIKTDVAQRLRERSEIHKSALIELVKAGNNARN